jgi:uncharacterized protein (DUF2336 family)
MVVAHFLQWIETARVGERAAAAAALARAYVQGDFAFEDRCAAEAALTLLLDDPSSKVRQALAEALSTSKSAPPQVIVALATDQPEVAAMILSRSPLLTEADLIQIVAEGHQANQKLIAGRANLSLAVSAAIAEIGEPCACVTLLANNAADVALLSFRRMAERFGHVPAVREALVCDARLPAEIRHMLLVQLGDALRQSPLVRASMGPTHADKVLRNACMKASLTLIERTNVNEYPALIEHIRLRGDLTAGFLIRALAHGKVDFFGAALVTLTGQAEDRVHAQLANGFDAALCALFAKAGLGQATHQVILVALRVWRSVARGKRVAGPQEVSWLMLSGIGGQGAQGDLAALLKSIHLDALRANAREHALAIAAA